MNVLLLAHEMSTLQIQCTCLFIKLVFLRGAFVGAQSAIGISWNKQQNPSFLDGFDCRYIGNRLILSLPKANLTKPRKRLNPELSNETQRCDHSNKSSRRVLSNGGVYIVAKESSWFCKFKIWTENTAAKWLE